MSGGAAITVSVRRVRADVAPLPLPVYQTADAAGLDLLADIPAPIILGPGARATVPTGLALEIPPGYEGQVRPRSGLALRHGVTVLNAPGTIDADYRGEVQVLLVNLGSDAVQIERGDRVAQLVIAAVARVTVQEARVLGATRRSDGGFGHTGR